MTARRFAQIASARLQTIIKRRVITITSQANICCDDGDDEGNDDDGDDGDGDGDDEWTYLVPIVFHNLSSYGEHQ